MDLCAIYQEEIKDISKEMEALQLKNHELKHQNKALISAEKKNHAMLLEIEALKNELQEAKRQHSAEKQKLVTELAEAKREMEDLNWQLESEKCLRKQVENDKLEAVENALFQTLEDLQRVSEESSAELKSEKTKQDLLHYEILDLQQMLQAEQDWRKQAEAENLSDFEMVENISKEFHGQLQKEKQLRAEAERSKVEAIKTAEELFRRLEQAQTLTEKLSAGSQALNDELKKEKEKQEALVRDIVELTRMLDEEMVLRVQAEGYEMEAIEVLEAVQKRTRRRSSARTFCCNRKCFSLHFSNRWRGRASH
ncbi:hypothetical protein GBF38_011301 [Nibea albiflora]|uniref:Uncharacterized protein n=1 Tax=Nibea albiflora TaxID=240163 RepID=A0ACB7ETV1_NIBAL|nr:hypothetical protein GBF38_011301 [Nibea albiflora]